MAALLEDETGERTTVRRLATFGVQFPAVATIRSRRRRDPAKKAGVHTKHYVCQRVLFPRHCGSVSEK